jgi:hypothetical protein
MELQAGCPLQVRQDGLTIAGSRPLSRGHVGLAAHGWPKDVPEPERTRLDRPRGAPLVTVKSVPRPHVSRSSSATDSPCWACRMSAA